MARTLKKLPKRNSRRKYINPRKTLRKSLRRKSRRRKSRTKSIKNDIVNLRGGVKLKSQSQPLPSAQSIKKNKAKNKAKAKAKGKNIQLRKALSLLEETKFSEKDKVPAPAPAPDPDPDPDPAPDQDLEKQAKKNVSPSPAAAATITRSEKAIETPGVPELARLTPEQVLELARVTTVPDPDYDPDLDNDDDIDDFIELSEINEGGYGDDKSLEELDERSEQDKAEKLRLLNDSLKEDYNTGESRKEESQNELKEALKIKLCEKILKLIDDKFFEGINSEEEAMGRIKEKVKEKIQKENEETQVEIFSDEDFSYEDFIADIQNCIVRNLMIGISQNIKEQMEQENERNITEYNGTIEKYSQDQQKLLGDIEVAYNSISSLIPQNPPTGGALSKSVKELNRNSKKHLRKKSIKKSIKKSRKKSIKKSKRRSVTKTKRKIKVGGDPGEDEADLWAQLNLDEENDDKLMGSIVQPEGNETDQDIREQAEALTELDSESLRPLTEIVRETALGPAATGTGVKEAMDFGNMKSNKAMQTLARHYGENLKRNEGIMAEELKKLKLKQEEYINRESFISTKEITAFIVNEWTNYSTGIIASYSVTLGARIPKTEKLMVAPTGFGGPEDHDRPWQKQIRKDIGNLTTKINGYSNAMKDAHKQMMQERIDKYRIRVKEGLGILQKELNSWQLNNSIAAFQNINVIKDDEKNKSIKALEEIYKNKQKELQEIQKDHDMINKKIKEEKARDLERYKKIMVKIREVLGENAFWQEKHSLTTITKKFKNVVARLAHKIYYAKEKTDRGEYNDLLGEKQAGCTVNEDGDMVPEGGDCLNALNEELKKLLEAKRNRLIPSTWEAWEKGCRESFNKLLKDNDRELKHDREITVGAVFEGYINESINIKLDPNVSKSLNTILGELRAKFIQKITTDDIEKFGSQVQPFRCAVIRNINDRLGTIVQHKRDRQLALKERQDRKAERIRKRKEKAANEGKELSDSDIEREESKESEEQIKNKARERIKSTLRNIIEKELKKANFFDKVKIFLNETQREFYNGCNNLVNTSGNEIKKFLENLYKTLSKPVKKGAPGANQAEVLTKIIIVISQNRKLIGVTSEVGTNLKALRIMKSDTQDYAKPCDTFTYWRNLADSTDSNCKNELASVLFWILYYYKVGCPVDDEIKRVVLEEASSLKIHQVNETCNY